MVINFKNFGLKVPQAVENDRQRLKWQSGHGCLGIVVQRTGTWHTIRSTRKGGISTYRTVQNAVSLVASLLDVTLQGC